MGRYFENEELDELWARLVSAVRKLTGLPSRGKWQIVDRFEGCSLWIQNDYLYADDIYQGGRGGEANVFQDSPLRLSNLDDLKKYSMCGIGQEVGIATLLCDTDMSVKNIHDILINYTGLSHATLPDDQGDYLKGILTCVRYIIDTDFLTVYRTDINTGERSNVMDRYSKKPLSPIGSYRVDGHVVKFNNDSWECDGEPMDYGEGPYFHMVGCNLYPSQNLIITSDDRMTIEEAASLLEGPPELVLDENLFLYYKNYANRFTSGDCGCTIYYNGEPLCRTYGADTTLPTHLPTERLYNMDNDQEYYNSNNLPNGEYYVTISTPYKGQYTTFTSNKVQYTKEYKPIKSCILSSDGKLTLEMEYDAYETGYKILDDNGNEVLQKGASGDTSWDLSTGLTPGVMYIPIGRAWSDYNNLCNAMRMQEVVGKPQLYTG